ncbi:MAG: TonB-dependent receptor [Cyclobacteriaceae bacterium]
MKLFPFIFLLISSSTFAQFTLTGKVVEIRTNEPLPFASIVQKNSSKGTTTNADGYFTLPNIPVDTITIQVSYIGYNTKDIKLSNEILKQGKFLIELEPSVAALTEVEVKADAFQFVNVTSGISQATLSTKQISLLPSIGEVDIFRSLQLLPGVGGTNENSSGLYVRGGTPDQNLVLLDGMTVYKVDHFFGFFSAFNANAVKDVQLYKGGFPAKYGGRLSSVVDMTGKTGSFEKVRGGAGLNLLSLNGYFEMPLSKKISFLVAGRRSYTDILQSNVFKSISDNSIQNKNSTGLSSSALSNTTVNTIQPIFYFYDWNSKLSIRLSESDLVTVSLYNGQDYLDQSRKYTRPLIPGQYDRLFNGVVAEKTNWGNQGASAKWSRQWNKNFYTNFLIAGSQYFSNYNRDASLKLEIPAQDSVIFSVKQTTKEDNKVRDLTARFDAEWLLSTKHKIEIGASFTQSDVNYKNLRNDTLLILERNQSGQYSSLYFSDNWQATKKLSITGGLRASYYQLTNQYLYEPRFSFAYFLTNKIKLKGAYGNYNQFVNRIINENLSEGSRDFWLMADGDQVKLSSSQHYIVGVSHETNGWLFDVEAYHKDLQNISEFSLRFRTGAQITSATQLFYSGKGYAEGVDFLLQKKSGNYTGWASYTIGRVRNTYADFNDGKEFPALNDQLHEFKITQNYTLGAWNFSSTFIFGSGKPFSEPAGQYSLSLLDGRDLSYIGVGTKNGSRLSPYHRLDVAVHHKFMFDKARKIKGDLGISIFNLYNRKNIWYYQYDFTQKPAVITEVTYLSITPNLSLVIDF